MGRDASDRPPEGRDGIADATVPVITSLTGSTPGGLPLAFNRFPRPELQPWIMRIGVTDVTLPQGQEIVCGTFSEHPVMRMIFGGEWTATTADGPVHFVPGEAGLPLYFGPSSRLMPLVAHGSFRVVTINCMPGFASAFALPPVPETIDRIYVRDPLTGSAAMQPGYHPLPDKRAWLDTAEDTLAAALAACAPAPPHRLMTAFETVCLTDPGASIERFASDKAVTRRTLERTILREWGLPPGEALRRARALDMASTLLGLGLGDEEQEQRLRYFDQSHLIREMRRYFDMTPSQIRHTAHPLLMITMEIRQSRRLDALARLQASDPRPWRDPGAEPGPAPE